MRNKILLFIPMYNCEKQIRRVLNQLTPEILSYIHEVLVIDNGSKDLSRDVAKKVIEEQEINGFVALNNDNYNLGGSHKVAFNYALEKGFDNVIVLHGDDQGNIHDLLPYLKTGEYKNYDSFLGARFHDKSSLIGYSKFRIFGNHVVNFLCSLLVGKRILDLGSGLNMYSTDFLKSRFYLPFANNLTFNVYILFWSIKKKSSLTFFPLTWREDDQISNAKVFKQAFHILGMALKMPFNSNSIFSKNTPYSKIDYGFKKL